MSGLIPILSLSTLPVELVVASRAPAVTTDSPHCLPRRFDPVREETSQLVLLRRLIVRIQKWRIICLTRRRSVAPAVAFLPSAHADSKTCYRSATSGWQNSVIRHHPSRRAQESPHPARRPLRPHSRLPPQRCRDQSPRRRRRNSSSSSSSSSRPRSPTKSASRSPPPAEEQRPTDHTMSPPYHLRRRRPRLRRASPRSRTAPGVPCSS